MGVEDGAMIEWGLGPHPGSRPADTHLGCCKYLKDIPLGSYNRRYHRVEIQKVK